MAQAAKTGADAAGSSCGAAQDSQSPPQAASDTDSWMHGLLTTEGIQLEDVCSFISALGTAHHCGRLREERDALYQQLAMRLLWACRSAKSDPLLERLRQELPADAGAGASDRGLLEAVFDQANSALVPAKDEVEPGRSATSLPVLAAPPPSPAVTAQGALGELGQSMLARASRDEEVIRAAEAVIGCLDAQARPSPLATSAGTLCLR